MCFSIEILLKMCIIEDRKINKEIFKMKKTSILSFVLSIVMLFAMTAVSASAMLGDINDDGSVTALDYMMIKRAFLGTYSIPEEKLAIADIDGDGNITTLDYMKVKRSTLGTYNLVPEVDPVIEAIETALENKGELKSNFPVSIPMSGSEGEASVSFEIIDGTLTLCGQVQVAALDAVVDIKIPMSKVADEYVITGQGNANGGKLTIDISGKLVASEYTGTSPLDIKFSASEGVDISKYEAALPALCKNAMNEFLAQADDLLISKEVGVDISDLGFEAYYDQLHPVVD